MSEGAVCACDKMELEDRAADASSAEEQVKRLSSELLSVQDQLRREKDRVTQVDKQRAGYEAQLREMQSRLEESEANAAKSAKKLTQKLEQRIVEMESAFDAERRRFDEAQKAARKQERRVTELLSQSEEEQRVKAQLQDNVDQLQQKLKVFKRQVEEAVCYASHWSYLYFTDC